MTPLVEIVPGRVVHPSTVEVHSLVCHACGYDTNVRNRGAGGELCGRCLRELEALLRRIVGPRHE